MPFCTQLKFKENLLVLAAGNARELYSSVTLDKCNQSWTWENWCYTLSGIAAILIVSSAVTATLKAGGKYLLWKVEEIVPTRYFWPKLRGRRPISKIYGARYEVPEMRKISRESTSKIIRTVNVGHRDPIDQHSWKHRAIRK